ncbi:cytochrome o ubiquinol oxidase subunit III [Bacillus sp. NP157]|nr:cytochrome o ubiquinol oxidase subunit III [Bacillus sp. NP157]
MTSPETIPTTTVKPDVQFWMTEEHHAESPTLLGFWIYLMSDCLIFAVLFACYCVLGRGFAGGPSGADLFELPLVATNTAMLLLSSITYGFGLLHMQQERKAKMMLWLAITALFGIAFVALECHEFIQLVAEDATPQRSAFLSSFFTLVGTHGLHVCFGLLWLVILLAQVAKHGLTAANKRRIMCLSMFWHFLDVIWIGVFSVVYLMGVLP